MSPQAEKLLKELRKLKANSVCPNCGTESSAGLGFGNVCVKFKTFICDYCKTSHQAISHRVKSITMSEWEMSEVKELMTENMGGNEVALHVWLKNAPAFGGRYPGGQRPKKGDTIDIFKNFITDCYEHGKFRAETPFERGNSSASLSIENDDNTSKIFTPPRSPVPATGSRTSVSRPRETQPVSKPAVTSSANLLDFDTNVSAMSSGDVFLFPTNSVSSQSLCSNSTSDVFDPFAASSTTSSRQISGTFGSADPFAQSCTDPFANTSPFGSPRALPVVAKPDPFTAPPVAVSLSAPSSQEVVTLSQQPVTSAASVDLFSAFDAPLIATKTEQPTVSGTKTDANVAMINGLLFGNNSNSNNGQIYGGQQSAWSNSGNAISSMNMGSQPTNNRGYPGNIQGMNNGMGMNSGMSMNNGMGMYNNRMSGGFSNGMNNNMYGGSMNSGYNPNNANSPYNSGRLSPAPGSAFDFSSFAQNKR